MYLANLVSFFQSTKTRKYYDGLNGVNYASNLNQGKEFVITWDDVDETNFNEVVKYDTSIEAYVFTISGRFEVNGVANALTVKDRVAINLTIQYCGKDDSNWIDLTNARTIYTGGMLSNDYTSVTVVTPTVYYPF